MATLKITVTDLKRAVLDAAWRERWVAGERPPAPEHCPAANGAPPVMGAEFHKLAEDFTLWLTDRVNLLPALALEDGQALWQALYDHVALERLVDWLGGPRAAGVPRLAECLRAFCNRLAALRARCAAFKDWSDVFLVQEFAVEGARIPVGHHTLVVNGRIDAARLHPEHGVEIVDYKLSGGQAGKTDFVQLAIYSQILARRIAEFECRGVLEYYTPGLHEVEVEYPELKEVFHQIVEPVLPELFAGLPSDALVPAPLTPSMVVLAPQPTAPPPAASPRTGPADHAVAYVIERTFADFGLAVEITGQIDAPQLRRFLVRPAVGVKVVSLANRAEDLQVRLALALPPLIRPSRGAVAIDIPKPSPDTVPWSEVMADEALTEAGSPMRFPIGRAVDNRLIVADLADPATCHALIGGASGSGKSEFLKSLVAALMQRGEPERLRLSIVDPKILTFAGLEGSPFLEDKLIAGLDEAIQRLEAAVRDLDARYRRMAGEGVSNLAERFAQGKTDIPYHVIVFDEFADLVLAGKDEKKTFEFLVTRIAQKGRAAGVHIVLATQRPDRAIVSGLIKANLPLKVCLKVTTDANSRIILDESGGQALFGRGDLLCDLGKGVERAQSPLVTQEEFLKAARLGG